MARRKVEFDGSDGQLAGLLELPDSAATCYALFAHCFSCGKDIAAASRISRALVARGIAVLRFDFTGLGNSDGDFANTNFSSNVTDLIAAANFLREEYRAPALMIGHSLGGTAVVAAAGQVPECRALVTLGSPHAPAHVIHQFADRQTDIEATGEADVDLGGRVFRIKKQFVDDVSTQHIDDAVGSLRRALLIMHSPVDRVVSINEAEKLYIGAKHPKSFVTLDDADHLLTRKEDAEYAAATIAAWVSRYVDTNIPAPPEETGVTAGEVEVREHNRQFTRTVVADQHTWLADEPVRVGGQELGPDPYEHLLAALGTCTSMTIRMYANRKGMALSDVTVRVRHDREHKTDCEDCDEHPRQIQVLSRDITLTGDLTEEERVRLLEIADRCPVHRTLEGELEIRSRLAT